MIHRLAADGVLLLHLGFILFVLLGGVLAVRWRWAPLLHLPAVAWGVYIELSGGSVDAPAPEIKAGQRYPELLAKPSLLVRIDTAFSKVMKDFESISGLGDELL